MAAEYEIDKIKNRSLAGIVGSIREVCFMWDVLCVVT